MLLKINEEKETTRTYSRTAKWMRTKKKSHGRFPLDEKTLHHHLDRVNYLSYFLKHYQLNSHHSPIGPGLAYLSTNLE